MSDQPPPAAEAIPPGLQLAWGLRDAGSRGPKRGLTLERIVAAGIKVAHTDGLAALSMARIAGELGVGTMSLYRYVAAKDELLLLMVDTALGAPPPPAAGEDWRAGLRRWALGVWEAYRRQPWVLRVPISGPPYGPNNVAWLDNALTADGRHTAVGGRQGVDRAAALRLRAQRGHAERRLRRRVPRSGGDGRLRGGLERTLDGVTVLVERTGPERKERPR